MTAVDTRKEYRVLLIMILLYSGMYSFVGAAFVQLVYGGFNILSASALGVGILVYSIVFSYILFSQWYSCSVEPYPRRNMVKGLFVVFTTAVFLAFIWTITGCLKSETVALCLLKMLIYSALYIGLDRAAKDKMIDCTGRRIRMMIPWIYGIIEPTLFGSAIFITLYGNKVFLVLYIIPILYYIIWRLSLRSGSREVKIINGILCIIIVGTLALFYYLILIRPKNAYQVSQIATIKSLTLAVCGAGIFGIPGLVEMAQVLRRDGQNAASGETENNKQIYKRIMQTVSIVDLCSIVLVHFAFTYLDVPMIYYVLYAVLSILWVLIARSHYEEKQSAPYQGSYILSTLYPALPAICLLACMYDVIPRPHQSLGLSPEVAFLSAGVHFSIDFLAVIGFGVKLNIKELIANFWRIRLVGYRTLGMFLSEILLLLTLALKIGNERTCVIMVLLTAELFLQVLGYIVFYSDKRFEEKPN